jgi:hypothetical protein
MSVPDAILVRLSESLRIEHGFLVQCIEESIVEIREGNVSNGSVLRLRKLERVCRTFNVDVPTAKHILELTERLAALEEEIGRLRLR